MVRQVDSSLLDEWERLKNPNWVTREFLDATMKAPSETEPADITRNRKTFTILVRNEVFRFLRGLAGEDYETVLSIIEPLQEHENAAWTIDKIKQIMEDYYSSDHSRICTDTKARSPKHTLITPDPDGRIWQVQQIITDPDEHNDWSIDLSIHLEASRNASRPILKLLKIGSV